MKITMKQNKNELTVALEGRLDTLTSPDLEEQLEPALGGIKKLVFDFANLTYISSAGLRVLLMCSQVMEKQGEMTLIHVNDGIMDVFEVTGFIDILNIA